MAAVARVAHLDVLEACFALRAGDTDRALEHLSKAFAGGPLTREWAQTDSDLDAVRTDPRWPH